VLPDSEQLVIAFDEALPTQTVLSLDFNYELSHGLNGFYSSTFTSAGHAHALSLFKLNY
jgi:hypothetical protein